MTFGDDDSPLPDKVRVNLAPRFDWYFVEDCVDDDILSGNTEAEFQINMEAMPETSEFQENIESQEESTVQSNDQRQYIVPGEIDSEITGTFRSNEQQGNIEISRTIEDDNQSSASFSTVKSNSSMRLARVNKVPEVLECDLTKKF